jgi:hypothetical protein
MMKRNIPNLFKILFALMILGWSSGVQAQSYSGGGGTSGDPYQINALCDLIYLSEHSADWGLSFRQTSDIVFPGPNTGDGFMPIGNATTPFTGEYDGDGHTISNLYINRSFTDDVGLFGLSNGVIRSLGLINVDITGQNNVGAVGGTLFSVDNCYSSGIVNGVYYVGGLSGYILSSNDSHSTCNVTGSHFVGGFAGYNLGPLYMCHSTGDIIGSSNIGGFAGYNDAASMQYCYSTGNVTGTLNAVGGLVGYNANSAFIENCYATGNVAGDSYVGGLVGGNDNLSSIRFCFSKGSVVGNTSKGGLLGWLDAGGFVEDSFWDKTTSGLVSSAGGAGKTSAEMKRIGTFLSDPSLIIPWDITLVGNAWAFNGTDNGGYPFLRFEPLVPAYIWLGTSSTDWATADNWSENAVPGPTEKTVFPNVVITPSISGGSEVVLAELTVEPGGNLTIASDGKLTVSGTLTNNAGETGLVINSGGSLIDNTPAIPATVNRDINDLDNDKWHLFTSPLITSVQATAASCFNGAYLDKYDEPSGEWARLLTDEYVLPGVGYSLNYEAGFKSLSFPGVLKSSPVEYTNLSYTSGAPGYLEGWNLIGNPYPCGLNPELCSVPTGMNAFAYVWDGAVGNYTTLSIGSNTHPGTIASLQGYFVRTNSTTNSLTLANEAKIHSGTFLKKDGTKVPEMLKLKIEGNGYSDAAFVRFHNPATAGFDQQFDAYKMPGLEDAPQLYSILVGEKATVNTLPSTGTNSEVTMGLKVGAEGTYAITAAGIGSFNADTPLLLEDLKSNTTQDLRKNPVYQFSAAPSDAEHRFTLHFKNTNGIGHTSESALSVYSNQRTVYVNNPKSMSGNIEIYDITGRLIRNAPLTGNTLDAVEIENYSGSLLVKVVAEKAIVTGKVIVN